MSTYWRGDVCVAITKDPAHKRKGLYIGNKYCIERLATFSNDEAAEQFERFMNKFLGVGEREE